MEELTLDPKNWDDIRELGHKIVDDAVDFIMNVKERPVWQKLSKEKKESINEPLPEESQDREEIYQEFKDKIFPFALGNISPRFWGWADGNGTMSGAFAELLIATMNSNAAGSEQMSRYVEDLVLNWSKELMGFPRDAGATITSGCSEATLIALAVARNSRATGNIREQGIESPNLTYYCSAATHSSVQKAIELLGVGNQNLRRIPVTNKFEIDCSKLLKAIQDDKKAKKTPIAIIANVGTVDTGAVDNLKRIREIADEHALWVHIDGAFGSIARLSNRYKHLVTGIEDADSVAFDFHKWLHIPFNAGCIIIRDEKLQTNTFRVRPAYLDAQFKGTNSEDRLPGDHGIQLSRNCAAIKIWFMFKEVGVKKYGKLVTQNIEQAAYLKKLIEKSQKIELMAPVKLNVVCFRYNPKGLHEGLSEEKLNLLNQEILYELHESGVAMPSSTRINGKFVIRVAVMNHRSKRTDFDKLYSSIISIGEKLIIT